MSERGEEGDVSIRGLSTASRAHDSVQTRSHYSTAKQTNTRHSLLLVMTSSQLQKYK